MEESNDKIIEMMSSNTPEGLRNELTLLLSSISALVCERDFYKRELELIKETKDGKEKTIIPKFWRCDHCGEVNNGRQSKVS